LLEEVLSNLSIFLFEILAKAKPQPPGSEPWIFRSQGGYDNHASVLAAIKNHRPSIA